MSTEVKNKVIKDTGCLQSIHSKDKCVCEYVCTAVLAFQISSVKHDVSPPRVRHLPLYYS